MLKIMLVDDEPAVLAGLERCLDWEAIDCEISAKAQDGLEAIRKIQQEQPDIVITDIRMPEMDGLALAAQIYNEYPQIKVIILTGFAEFEYAQKAIQFQVVDFVLKPTRAEKLANAVKNAKKIILTDGTYKDMSKALEDTSEKNLRLQQNLLLYDLIYGVGLSTNIPGRFSGCNLEINYYYILLVAVHSTSDECNYSEYMQQVRGIIQDCVAPHTVYFVPKADQYSYVVLCTDANYNPFPACEKAIEITDNIADYSISIGISQISDDPMKMRKLASEATSAQQFAEYTVETQVMSFENMPKLSSSASHWIMNELKLIESAIENQNRSVVRGLFSELFQFIHDEKIPISEMKRICTIICNYCTSVLYNFNILTVFPASRTLTTENLLETGTILEMQDKLLRFVEDVMDYIGENPDSMDGMIYGTKKYIEQHYKEEIALENLAERVHLSPSYLSKLFKKKIGINISTYIQNVRIEQAVVLLKTTNMKTYEIADAVGIYDPVYFSRMFKKIKGMKPKEFRSGN